MTKLDMHTGVPPRATPLCTSAGHPLVYLSGSPLVYPGKYTNTYNTVNTVPIPTYVRALRSRAIQNNQKSRIENRHRKATETEQRMKLISGDILEEMVNSDDMTLAEFNELAMLMQRVAHREMELLERIAGLEAQVKLLKEDLQ